jgi:hypothetical protein
MIERGRPQSARLHAAHGGGLPYRVAHRDPDVVPGAETPAVIVAGQVVRDPLHWLSRYAEQYPGTTVRTCLLVVPRFLAISSAGS